MPAFNPDGVSDSLLVPAVAIDAGENVPVKPLGKPVTESASAPVKPFKAAVVTVSDVAR